MVVVNISIDIYCNVMPARVVEALPNVLDKTAFIFRVEECQKMDDQFPPPYHTTWCHIPQ
jgi:hypothetical protein